MECVALFLYSQTVVHFHYVHSIHRLLAKLVGEMLGGHTRATIVNDFLTDCSVTPA
jgi:hypothetical protein